MARTALLHSNLPKALWPEVVARSAYTLGKSPLEIFLPQADAIQQRSKFRTFGEAVWVRLSHTTGKLRQVHRRPNRRLHRDLRSLPRKERLQPPRSRTPGRQASRIAIPVDTEEGDEEEDKPRSEGESDLQKPEAKDDAVIPKPPGPLHRFARERRAPERCGKENLNERTWYPLPHLRSMMHSPDRTARHGRQLWARKRRS